MWFHLICLAGLISAAQCTDDIGLQSLGKVMEIQEAMASNIASSAAAASTNTQSLGESDSEVSSLEPADEDSLIAHAQQQKLHQMVHLQKLIVGLKQSSGAELGESNEQSTLEKLMSPTSDESDPISDVETYLQGASRVTPSEMSDLKRFYIDQTVKALHKLHGESHQIMKRYADKELRTLAQDSLSFEGLSVGVQNGLDKQKTQFQTMQACLTETSRLCKFLADIQKIKAHPWHDDWSRKDEQKAESLIRLHQSESEISDGIEELMARVAQGLPLDHKPDHPSEQTAVAAAAEQTAPPSKQPTQPPTKRKIHVPMSKVGGQLKSMILSQLDKALEIMNRQKTGKQTGLSHRQEAALNLLLKQITQHVLRSTVSYEEWSDAGAIREEEQAVAAGDPGRPSKLSTTAQPMLEDKILEHFLHEDLLHKKGRDEVVPSRITSMMLQGVHLADGSILQVHVGAGGADRDVDLTESNEYEDLPQHKPYQSPNMMMF